MKIDKYYYTLTLNASIRFDANFDAALRSFCILTMARNIIFNIDDISLILNCELRIKTCSVGVQMISPILIKNDYSILIVIISLIIFKYLLLILIIINLIIIINIIYIYNLE